MLGNEARGNILVLKNNNKKHKRSKSREKKIERRSSSAHNPINGWTEDLDNLVANLGNDSSIYKWLHMQNAILVKDRLELGTLIASIIGLIIGTGGIASVVSTTLSDNKTLTLALTIFISLLGFTSAAITIGQRIYAMPDRIEKHKDAEQKFSWLFFDTQAQLRRPKIDRESGNSYYRWSSRSFIDASKMEDVDDKIIKKYQMTFPDGNIPGIDGIRQVVIRRDEPDSSSSDENISSSSSSAPNNVLNKPSTIKNTDIEIRPIKIGESASSTTNNSLKGHIHVSAPAMMQTSLKLSSADISPDSSPTKKSVRQFRRNMKDRVEQYANSEANGLASNKLAYELKRQERQMSDV